MFLCVKALGDNLLSGFSYLLFASFGVFTLLCILEQVLGCKAEMPWGRDLILFGIWDKAAKSVMRERLLPGHVASQHVPLPSARTKPSLVPSGCCVPEMSLERHGGCAEGTGSGLQRLGSAISPVTWFSALCYKGLFSNVHRQVPQKTMI